MEFKIGDRIRITNYNGCLNDKFGYIVKIINDDHPLPKYCIQLSDKVIDSHGNIIKFAQLRLSNSQLVKYEEILEDDKNESTKNHDVLSHTRFTFKNNKLFIEINYNFDKYKLYDSIKIFIEDKFKNSKNFGELLFIISKTIALSKNDFKEVFSNLFEGLTNFLTRIPYSHANDDMRYLRDVFHLLSVHGMDVNQKDFDLIQNDKRYYEDLSYNVVIQEPEVIQRSSTIYEGDVVEIIDKDNKYYGFRGIVAEVLYTGHTVDIADGIYIVLGKGEIKKITKNE